MAGTHCLSCWQKLALALVLVSSAEAPVAAGDGAESYRVYANTVTRLSDPRPLLADYPEFVEPVEETVRYEAPRLVDDAAADLEVRA